MFYETALYVALALFFIGLIHKVDAWFFHNIGIRAGSIRIARRAMVVASGILRTLFSPKIIRWLRVFFVDILMQWRILKDRKDPLAWGMHIFIFWGFVPLLLLHALDGIITVELDPTYQSTLNPYMFLRNFFGALLVIGLVLAIIRRLILLKKRIWTSVSDIYILVFLIVLSGSGFLLEGTKIISNSAYSAMVEDYAGPLDPDEARALEAYWVNAYGLASSSVRPPFSPEVLNAGMQLSEASCLECHSQPQSAFVSYSISRLLLPIAGFLDKASFSSILWYVHIVAAFSGLAFFVFTKLFHVVGTPVSLMMAELSNPKSQEPGVAVMCQLIERDGCRHGGLCHAECPVRGRRMQRIELLRPYEPMLQYIDQKSAESLGSRNVKTQQ